MLTKIDVHRKRPRTYNPKSLGNVLYGFCVIEGKIKCARKLFWVYMEYHKKRIRHFISLLVANETPKKNRGKNENCRTNASPEEIIEKIHEHIMSFPVKQDKYGNRDIKFSFLYKILGNQSNLWVLF